MEKPPCPQRRTAASLQRYVKFCLVGGSGVLVDMVVLYALHSSAGLGWNLSLSKALAAETALVNNFFWNERWTFRSLTPDARDSRLRATRFLKFNLICLVGIGWNVLLINFQVKVLGWNAYLANLVAIVLVSVWNFWLTLRWGWQPTALGQPK